MANRVITIEANGEYIKSSSSVAGASGAHNAVDLEFTFSDEWDGTTKKVYFFDALGGNAVFKLLGDSDRNEAGNYQISIPSEPMAYPGKMSMTLKGYVVDGEEIERIMMAATYEFTVLQAKLPSADTGPEALTPSQADQLFAEINAIKAQSDWDQADDTELDYIKNKPLIVELSGDQTINGVKTFASFPFTPASAPVADYHVANKKYIDGIALAAGAYTDKQAQDAVGGILQDSTSIDFTYNGTDGFVTAAVKPSVALTGTPTAPTAASGTNTTQLATTAFVQQQLNGLTFSVDEYGILTVTYPGA